MKAIVRNTVTKAPKVSTNKRKTRKIKLNRNQIRVRNELISSKFKYDLLKSNYQFEIKYLFDYSLY